MQANLFQLVVLYCLWLIPMGVGATQPTTLTDQQPSILLDTHLDFLHDPGGKLTSTEVASRLYANQFSNTGEAAFSPGFTEDVFWLRVHVDNQSSHWQRWYLQVLNMTEAPVEAYWQTATTLAQLQTEPYFLYYTYPLPLTTPGKHTLYVRVQNKGDALSCVLRFSQAEHRSNIRLIVFFALMSGGLLALGVYNLLLFASLRESSYGWLGVAILGATLELNRNTGGLLHEYLGVFPDYQHLYTSFGYIAALGSAKFIRQLLGTPRHTPLIDLGLRGMLWVSVACLLNILWLPYASIWFNAIFIVIGLLILLATLRLRYLQVYVNPKLSWGLWVLVLGVILPILSSFGIPSLIKERFSPTELSDALFSLTILSIALFVLMLSLAQADHVRRLREEAASANAANKAKGDFLTTMSHELRTPMNAVVGAGLLLQDTALTPQQRSYVDKLEIAARHMLTLIGDILDITRIERQALRLEQIPFDLKAVATELETLFVGQAAAKGLAFSIYAPADSVWLQGDPTRLKQILMNLLGNAIKFTERGSVECTLVVGKKSGDGLPVTFSVTDSGIGITPQQQVHLFRPFSQADSSTSRRYGGSGLGLAISAQLVQQMGGELELASHEGKGSRFFFTLDFALSETPLVEAIPASDYLLPAPTQGVHLLLVDDDELNRFFANELLKTFGLAVTTVASGQAALAFLRQQTVDLVFMDVSMPEMDGYATTRRIREFKSSHELPIIALTAHVMAGIDEQCFAAGMNDYLPKPFDKAQLQQVLQRWLR
ncbi:MAG: response regulator [Gammaproteobacteria bacterium]|nr:response regulator [Gammaproteobacteria bacterium]MBU1726001.1 response regulator [Gammaproteobacteria bacterium]MBU2005089.1 response regulator [Gammaproteobacteria bacterium]